MGITQNKWFYFYFTRILLFSLIVLASIFKIVKSQQCSDFSLNKQHFGQRLVGNDILTISETSIGTCVRKCFELTHCLSINFNKESGLCNFKNITLNEHLANSVVQDATFILSDISAWPKAMAGACGDKPCSERDICLPAGNSFFCINSDCLKAPVIEQTTSTGSLEIGGKMVYSCTQPSQHVIGKDYIQCEWMQTWSPSVDIACTEKCPTTDWKLYNNSCYLFGDGSSMTYAQSVNFCENLDAVVVQIDTADENQFVKDYLLNISGVRYWLGLSDATVEGVWRWSTTERQATYFDWYSGEPDGLVAGNLDEDCVIMLDTLQYQWVDVPCSGSSPSICELRIPV